jgi:hypothetical protein
VMEVVALVMEVVAVGWWEHWGAGPAEAPVHHSPMTKATSSSNNWSSGFSNGSRRFSNGSSGFIHGRSKAWLSG